MLAYQSSSVSSAIGLLRPLPALLTRMSTRPRPLKRGIGDRGGTVGRGDVGGDRHDLPADGRAARRRFARGSAACAAPRPRGRTLGREQERDLAPMPWLPPVTIATRPARPRSIGGSYPTNACGMTRAWSRNAAQWTSKKHRRRSIVGEPHGWPRTSTATWIAGSTTWRSTCRAARSQARTPTGSCRRARSAWARPIAFEFHHLAVDGDVVLADWTITVHGEHDGVEVKWRGMSVCQLRDGQIVWWREYYEDPATLRADPHPPVSAPRCFGAEVIGEPRLVGSAPQLQHDESHASAVSRTNYSRTLGHGRGDDSVTVGVRCRCRVNGGVHGESGQERVAASRSAFMIETTLLGIGGRRSPDWNLAARARSRAATYAHATRRDARCGSATPARGRGTRPRHDRKPTPASSRSGGGRRAGEPMMARRMLDGYDDLPESTTMVTRRARSPSTRARDDALGGGLPDGDGVRVMRASRWRSTASLAASGWRACWTRAGRCTGERIACVDGEP